MVTEFVLLSNANCALIIVFIFLFMLESVCAIKRPESNEVLPSTATKMERVQLWIHEHPTTSKIIKVVTFLFGAAMLATLPYSFAALGITAAIGIGIIGIISVAVSLVAHMVLDLVAPPQHDMKNHVFPAGQCEGGKLYYQGDIPILTLDADDPFIAGKAHGYLLGDSLNRVFKQVHFAVHAIAKQPRAAQLQDAIEQIKRTIPEKYLVEMQGLVEGFKKWSSEHPLSFPTTITLEDVILLHLMPDSMHFNTSLHQKRGQHPAQAENRQKVACAVVIDRDENGDFLFARNMDWPSFGLAGTYSLIINRKQKGKAISTAEVGIPGFIGTITGMNAKGLSMAMNVCSGFTREVHGMPAAFFNRHCLENCKDVEDLQSFLRWNQPLGPYHMTAADPDEAASFHFYQSEEHGGLVKRKWKDSAPLTVLNYRYPDAYSRYGCLNSTQREGTLNAWFEKAREEELPKSEKITRSLSLPYVNNGLTTHSVVMKPETRSIEVSFNNAFAAKYPRHKLSTNELFS